jgi:hypothetical protein
MFWPFRFFRREEQGGGIEANMVFGYCHIENLLHVPPQMIDDRERHPTFAIEQVLKLVTFE